MQKMLSLTASIACALTVLSYPIVSSTVEAQKVVDIDQARLQKARDVIRQLPQEDVQRLVYFTGVQDAFRSNDFETEWRAEGLHGRRPDGKPWKFAEFYRDRDRYYQYPQDSFAFIMFIEPARYGDFYTALMPMAGQYSLQRPLEAPMAGRSGMIVTQPWDVDQVATFGDRFNTFAPGITEFTAPYAFTTDVFGATQAAGVRIEDVARVAKDAR